MFTGIVQGTAEIVAIEEAEAFRTHIVAMPEALRAGLAPGASVSHNGVCLTVTAFEGERVRFDLMRETLRVTNLGALKVGDRVNIERAARFGDEIGGHAMSGHVIAMAELVEIDEAPNNRRLWFELPRELGHFLFDKGYIGVDGISLTIGEVRQHDAAHGPRFSVNLIPETLARTVLADRKPGDRVNIEIDPQTQAIVETVERVLALRLSVSE
ncbi:riboflavin synthase subunit alpha [Halomonas sp. TRM85114]|uniref:riboflavin synthase subunit alpha n=1 Tax=Halomonas jincaotanensis TaxID=2810616 RepID=UPI001BD2EE10|nr:riboflavin synthase subunit alpha [Halomonas jincaotanensis]MBS9404165.1 riboflavin synthase subunit alpha [Halomonas jincaotanensis]